MGTNPVNDNDLGQHDEHFPEQDKKSVLHEIDKNDTGELENKFQAVLSHAEAKIEMFFTSILASTVSEETKQQIEEVKLSMKNEFVKMRKWFSTRIEEMKSNPNDLKKKMSDFKEEFLVQWADLKNFVSKKIKYVKSFASTKKSSINAEEIITKAQSVVNDVILPKLKDLYAISKAATAGAIKGVKEMKENKKDESEKK